MLLDQETLDIMQDFFDSIEYQGDIDNWEETEETYEDPDEEEI